MCPITISEIVVKNVLNASIQQGISLERLKQSDIDFDGLAKEPDASISLDKYLQIERKIRKLAGNEGFFLYVGGILDPMPLSVKHIILSSSDNQERINYVLRYLRLICGAYRMALVEKEDTAEIYFHVSPSHYQTVSTVQMVISNIFCGLRSTYPDAIKIIRISFQHDCPEYRQLYTDFFQVPVLFNQEENSVLFQKDVLSMTHNGESYLKGVLIQHADHLLKELDFSEEFEGAVRKIIIENLHTGDVNIGLIEQAMNMSRQTIYRRLKKEHTSFSTLLDEIRKDCSIEYLKVKEKTIEETAFLLGYSETSAFNHAFRRWFGRSAIEYRKNIIERY